MRSDCLNRRGVIIGIGASAVGSFGCAIGGRASFAQAPFRAYPFTLGIASGDPAPDGFVIWTRLAPLPFVGGGMPNQVVDVGYEVAEDDLFRRVVRKDTVQAGPQAAHSIHVEVAGLAPSRDYYFRFTAGGVQSPVGRAKTLPPFGATIGQIKFAAVGCQRWEHGYYSAFRHLADERLDFAFHYGDYIYEYAQIKTPPPDKPFVRAMPIDFAAARTLADYRNRYAVYKSDTDLQAAHASTPFMVSFDDHEVANNYMGDTLSPTDPAARRLGRHLLAYGEPLRHPRLKKIRRLPGGWLYRIRP